VSRFIPSVYRASCCIGTVVIATGFSLAGCSATPTRPAAGTTLHPSTTSENLQKTVSSRLQSMNAQTSLYAEDLATGREVSVRADVAMNTVSVIKLAIMVLAYRDADSHRLNLDERYQIRPQDLRGGTGVLQTFAAGLSPTYRDLVTQMIVTSDNTATDILITKLGLERVNRLLDSLGYRETRLRTTVAQLFQGVWERVDPKYRGLTDRQVFDRGFPEDSALPGGYLGYVQDSTKWLGRTTAREMSRFLEQLERGQLASPNATQQMRDILLNQFYSSRLPHLIGFRVGVGHKTGDWPPYIGNDVGIIYAASGPIVVSLFTNANRGNFWDLEAGIGEVAEDILNAWETGGAPDSGRR
jgi:hypothetical protein